MTEDNELRRGPGRPRKTPEGGETITPDAQAAVPVSRRRSRASVGGFRQKLDAPQRPGFQRRWVDDDPSRIMAMRELGYVEVSEAAGDGAARTDGMGTRISRHGGKRDDGAPQKLVLMECRDEDYVVGVQDKEDALKPFEEAIRAKRDTTGRVENAYEPRDGSSITHSA